MLNRARWAALQASQILLGGIVLRLVPPGAALVLGADDRVERRSGRQIKAKGCSRAAVRASKKHELPWFGLKGVALMGRVPVPWAQRVWALPFWTVRCWPPKSPHQGRHKTRVDWVGQMMKQARRWLPKRLLVLVVDGGFAAVALALACRESQVVRVSRLRLDAALSHPPVLHPPSKRGRKPTQGQRQRSLKIWAARTDTPWQETLVDWYGGQRKRLGVFSRSALGYTPGWAPVAIRLVLGRDPESKLHDAAFFCTARQATPAQILRWVVMRWSGEVTFEEARAPLGVETQRQGSDRASARTTPVLLGLFSLVTLLALRLRPTGQVPVETAAWDHKPAATFSDCLLLVRRYLWRARYWVNSVPKAQCVPLPREAFECLLNDLPLAA